jgi:ABC transport system ATP-binding/permease protein
VVDPDEGDGPADPIVARAEPDVLLRSAALMLDSSRLAIHSGGTTIGSAPEAAIRLAERGVSPLHASVEAASGGHVVIDRGSETGTFLNGERLAAHEPRRLERGDSIALGGRLLHYVPGGGGHTLAPITPVDAGRLRATKDVFTIGRGIECDLTLDHPTVARLHAIVRVKPGRAIVESQESSTAVRVNGRPVRRSPLQPGDQIAVGPFRIVFDGDDLIERAAANGLPVSALGVAFAIGGVTILQPTELHLRPGELVAIIGESGAGKTTLLKTLAGVMPPTTGRVVVGGEDVTARLSEIGYVPQSDLVHDQLTVREALDYAAQLRLPPDTSREERAARVQDVITRLALADRADNRVASLSGGQRKRASVGTELLHSPGVLFLDEPTTGLDPALERRLMDVFRGLAATGQTVALVTHATGSISLCDRVVAMAAGGTVCFDGTPDALLAAFGADTFDEVYSSIGSATGRYVALAPEPRRLPRIVAPTARPFQQSAARQAAVLTSRYARLLFRDRRLVRITLLQVPLLGILTAQLFAPGVFNRSGAELFAGKAAQLVFLMVTIALWLGSINAAREIVKERSVLARELAVGVGVGAYIASKLTVLFLFAVAQTLTFSVLVLVQRPLHEPGSVLVELLAVLVLSSWIAVLLGLLVSAYATSEDQATAIIPLLLVPQLLFGGAIVSLEDMSAPMRALAGLVPARWSFAGSGNAIDLQERLTEDPRTQAGHHYGPDFFTLSFGRFLLVSLVFGAVLLGLLRLLIRRRAATAG